MVWATQAASGIELSSAPMRAAEAVHADRPHEVARAIADLRRGDVVLLREKGVSALILAAEMVDEANLARLYAVAGLNGQYPVGSPVLATTARRAEALGLANDAEALSRAVELHLPGDTTLPVVDLATLRKLADPTMGRMPGDSGVTVHMTTDESMAAAAVDLAKHARLLPVVLVLPAIAREAALAAERDGVISLTVPQIRHHRNNLAYRLRRVADAKVPLLDSAETRIVAFRPEDGSTDHLAIVIGEPQAGQPILARIHSECFTGDLLGSLRCDCGDQLRGAIRAIAESGTGGVVLYLAQEGRGIGLVNKLRAYTLQDAGYDTVDANMQLGFDSDERVYLPAAEMLRQLGFDKVRLMTNNPAKLAALAHHGVEVVERVPHAFPANPHNQAYLETKAKRSGHMF